MDRSQSRTAGAIYDWEYAARVGEEDAERRSEPAKSGGRIAKRRLDVGRSGLFDCLLVADDRGHVH